MWKKKMLQRIETEENGKDHKRSYAEAVSGPKEEEEIYNPGFSVIRTKYVGFGYHDITTTAKGPETANVRRSPRKKGKMSVSPTKNNQDDHVIILSDSSSCCSPVKGPLPPLPATSTIHIPSSDSEYEVPKKKKKGVKGLTFDSESDSDSLSDPWVCRSQEYHNDDNRLPVYSRPLTGLKTKDVVSLLLDKDTDDSKIAKGVPSDISRNCVFIVESKDIGNWKSILSDDMGVWLQSCANKHSVLEDGGIVKLGQSGDSSPLTVIRYNYRCKSSMDLHRVIIRLESKNRDVPSSKIFVQYYFDNEEHSINIMSHGNSKKRMEPYYRTNENTKDNIKIMAPSSTPKQVFHKIIDEQGGLSSLHQVSEKPRDRQQISNFKRKEEKDILLNVMDMAKQEECAGTRIIRDISTTPEFKVFLASDDQLLEVEKFCTNVNKFSVLGIDSTYNLGEFYATITTYRHPLLLSNRNVEPVLFGPTLLHQRRTFDSFFSLPENMLKYKPNLSKILVFGTDGEVNISDSFEVSLPNAKHLLCDLHMRDNVKSKIKELGIHSDSAKLLIEDIFGKNIGECRKPGLVDAMSAIEFDKRLSDMELKWKTQIENVDSFITYFQNHKAQLIKNCMTAELRAMCGLGYPPKPYTQNANECANSVIQADVKHQKLPMDEFITNYKTTVSRQHREILLSICGQGQYRVKPEFEKLKVEERKFFRMTDSQKRKAYINFTNGLNLIRRSPGMLENPDKQTNNISVDPENSGIITLPAEILQQIFFKADKLLDNESNVSPCPGATTDKFLVTSANIDEPHLVKVLTSGQVICDKKCYRFQSYKLCSHTVAIAEKQEKLDKFLKWYVQQSKSVSLTNLANFNLSKSRGKKPNKSTQIRKGPANKTSTEILTYLTTFEEDDINHPDSITNRPSTSRPPAPRPPDNGYILYLLKYCDKKVSICYGCKGSLKENGEPPPPPRDMTIVTKTKRKFTKDGIERVGETGNVYFHVNSSCVKLHNNYFIPSLVFIPDEIRPHLSPCHKEVLKTAMIIK